MPKALALNTRDSDDIARSSRATKTPDMTRPSDTRWSVSGQTERLRCYLFGLNDSLSSRGMSARHPGRVSVSVSSARVRVASFVQIDPDLATPIETGFR